MGDKIVKSKNLCCQPVVFPSLSLLKISLEKIALGNKKKQNKKTFFVNRGFGQKFTRNAKKYCFVFKCNFGNFND